MKALLRSPFARRTANGLLWMGFSSPGIAAMLFLIRMQQMRSELFLDSPFFYTLATLAFAIPIAAFVVGCVHPANRLVRRRPVTVISALGALFASFLIDASPIFDIALPVLAGYLAWHCAAIVNATRCPIRT